MSLTKEIEELQKKAGSYELLQEEYTRLKEGVKEVISGLNSLLGTISGLKEKTSRNGSAKPLIERLYHRLKTEDNFQVTREVIEKEVAFLNIEFKSYMSTNAMVALSKMEGVKKTKDGRSVRLFYIKPKKEEAIKFEKTSFMG